MKSFLLKLLIPLVASVLVAWFVLIWMRIKRCGWREEIILEDHNEDFRFTYKELERSTARFSEECLLGTGSSGSVYKGTLRSGLIVAVKVFNPEDWTSSLSFDTERKIMLGIYNRFVIKLLYSCNSSRLKALVMEYMPNGTLEKWLYTHNFRLDIFQRLEIMIAVASAIKYLHYESSRVVIHCDIKPSNVLLDEDMIAHLGDFSAAKIVVPGVPGCATSACSFGYAAPEIGLTGNSRRTDVYSFGVMLMETFTRKKPTDEMFGGEKSLRIWVLESLALSNLRSIVDPFVLQTQEDNFYPKLESIMGIMGLAIGCTSELPSERLDTKEVVYGLLRIKRSLLQI